MKKTSVWFITGCSSGIGEGIANAALESGDKVVVTARNGEKLKNFEDRYPDSCLALELDITKPEDIDRAVSEAYQRFGYINVLVNNAGYAYQSSVEEGEEGAVRTMFDTNFFGPVRLTNAVLPKMREMKDGLVINISSIAAVRSGTGSGYYSASKAAIDLVSEALAQELQPLGVGVMIVEPGMFRTKFYELTNIKGSEKRIEDYKDTAWKSAPEVRSDRHDQLGNPVLAGKVIVELAKSDKRPLRYVMGSDAYRYVTNSFRSRIEEADAWKTFSERTDFE